MTDGIEDGGCKTCYLCNKQKEKTFRLYLWGLAGGKRKFLELIANLRNKGKGQHWGPVQTVSDVTSRQLYRTLIWSCELKKKTKKHTHKKAENMQTPFYISFYWVYHKLHINFLGIRSINWGNFRSDEEPTLETSASKLATAASLRYQLN